MSGFIHLRLHTEYSVTNSTVRIKPLMRTLDEQGSDAVAVSDTDNLFGSFKFSSQALACGVKPILGADVNVAMSAKDPGDCGRLTLLCASRQGYQNLCQLISLAYETRAQRRRHEAAALLPFDELRDRCEGLIALSAGREGLLGRLLDDGKESLASERAGALKDCFGDRFYLSIERLFGDAGEKEHIEYCLGEGQRLGIAVVATNNVQFLKRGDYTAHTIRVGISMGLNSNDKRLAGLYSKEQYLKTPDAMGLLFKDLPDTLANSIEIAQQCNFFLTTSPKPFLPRLQTPGESSPEDYLREYSGQSLDELLERDKDAGAKADVYRDRLGVELDIIIKMGFAAYYLIVEEFVSWARANGVVVGPGRGSGPGSLVAYVLGITRVDPIRYDLLFERFLNPERVSLPDFDIDFDDHRRDDVIAHVAEQYGRGQVSQIITFGTLGARASVRDVGRVLGKPYGLTDRIAKLIPFAIDQTLAKALESKEFADEYKSAETREIVDRAIEVEGLARHPGRHAGGVVIAPDPLVNFCPMYRDEDGITITQFDKDDLEAIGLVKYDFLGLRALSTIRDALENIHQFTGERVDIDTIDLNDKKSLDLINQQRTLGVFQLESPGMRELISKLKPDSFNDIIALVALFRPGPMEARVHDIYCERKHGTAQTTYYHKSLRPVLEPTHGVFIYQEQVMEAARVMAGYSLGDADLLRRAMGKKKPEELDKQRPVFIEGCRKNNISEKVAVEVFDLLLKFGGYGFNKSHSVSYGLVAFQTAWLKSHHPAAYMASLMTNEPDHDNIARMIRDCANMGIAVSRPDINESMPQFLVLDGARLRYGLGRIKGVGTANLRGDSFVEQVCRERDSGGPYKDFVDFLIRVPLEKCTTKTLICLIGSGAFDGFAAKGEALRNRLALIDAVERKIIDFAQARKAAKSSGQGGLFGGGDEVNEFEYADVRQNDRKALAYEYEALNFYLGDHPLRLLREGSPDLNRLPRLASLRERRGTHWCLFEVRDIATFRKGGQLTLSCDDEDSNIIMFFSHERVANSASSPWICKQKIALAVVESGMSRANIRNLYLEEDMREQLCLRHEFELVATGGGAQDKGLAELARCLGKAAEGRTRLLFHYRHEGRHGVFELDKGVKLDKELYQALCESPACMPAKAHYDIE